MTLNVHMFSVNFMDAETTKKNKNSDLTSREKKYAECLIDGFNPIDFFGYMTFVGAPIVGMCHEYSDFVDLMDLKGRYQGMKNGGF